MSGHLDQGKMVQIIEIDSREGKVVPKFYGDELKDIVTRKPHLKKYLVVSVIGSKRNGKSFLTNILICHLRHLEKNPGDYTTNWLQKDVEITGVAWRQDKLSVTKGIWMWDQPFVVHNGEEEIGVLLLDCQGLYDADDINCEITDTLITIFSLELSKIHMVNVKGDLKSYDLVHLEKSIAFANLSTLENVTKELFNSLVIVHRDWQEDANYGAFKDFFARLREERQLSAGEQLIEDAFTKCIEFMIPLPGKAVRLGSATDNVCLSDLMKEEDTREFLQYATELSHLLFLKLPKEDDTNYICSEHLVKTVQKLERHYSNGVDREEFHSPAEVLVHSTVERVVDNIKINYLQEFENNISKSKVNSEEKLREVANEHLAEAFKYIALCENEIEFSSEATSMKWRSARERMETMFQTVEQEKFNQLKMDKASLVRKLKVAGGATAIAAATGAIGIATGGLVFLPCVGFAVVGGIGAAAAAAGGAIGGFSLDKILKRNKSESK